MASGFDQGILAAGATCLLVDRAFPLGHQRATRVATILLTIFTVVILAEIVVTQIRKRII